MICAVYSYAKSEMLSNTHTHRPSTVTLAVHARQGLMTDCLIQCGITKPLIQLKIEDVPNLVHSIALHATVLKVKAAIDQFMDGLREACLLPSIQKYPHVLRDLFVKSSTDCLDSGMTHAEANM